MKKLCQCFSTRSFRMAVILSRNTLFPVLISSRVNSVPLYSSWSMAPCVAVFSDSDIVIYRFCMAHRWRRQKPRWLIHIKIQIAWATAKQSAILHVECSGSSRLSQLTRLRPSCLVIGIEGNICEDIGCWELVGKATKLGFAYKLQNPRIVDADGSVGLVRTFDRDWPRCVYRGPTQNK